MEWRGKSSLSGYPRGLTWSASSHSLSGTIGKTGTYSLIYGVTNSAGSDTEDFAWNVTGSTPSSTAKKICSLGGASYGMMTRDRCACKGSSTAGQFAKWGKEVLPLPDCIACNLIHSWCRCYLPAGHGSLEVKGKAVCTKAIKNAGEPIGPCKFDPGDEEEITLGTLVTTSACEDAIAAWKVGKEQCSCPKCADAGITGVDGVWMTPKQCEKNARETWPVCWLPVLALHRPYTWCIKAGQLGLSDAQGRCPGDS